MAAKDEVVVDVRAGLSQLELLWIRHSLDVMAKQIMRSRSKEVVGGEVWTARTNELVQVTSLRARYA